MLEQCRQISSLVLVRVDKNARYKDRDFKAHQEEHRLECKEKLKLAHLDMVTQLQELFAIFQDGPDDVQGEWVEYITQVDDCVLKSLLSSVKKTLLSFSSFINGNDDTGENQTLFFVFVILKDNRLECRPSLIDLTHIVNSVAKELIGIVKTVPRMQDSLITKNPLINNSKKNAANYFYEMISSNEHILNLVVKIMNGMAAAATDVRRWLLTWNRYKALWEMDKDSYIRRYSKANQTLEVFDRDITYHKDQQLSIEGEGGSHTINFIKLDTTVLKATLSKHSNEWQEKLTGLLSRNTEQELSELHNMFEINKAKLTRTPQNVAQLSANIELTASLNEEISVIDKRLASVEATYRVLEKFEDHSDAKTAQMLANLRPSFEVMKEELTAAGDKLEKSKATMKKELRAQLAEYCCQIRKLRDDVTTELASLTPDLSFEIARTKMSELRNLTQAKREQESQLQPGLDLFSIEQPDDKALRDSERDIDLKYRVWVLTNEWEDYWSKWREEPLKKLETEYMETLALGFSKNAHKLRLEIGNCSVCKSLQQRLDQFRKTFLPLLLALNNEAMRPRHWTALKQALERDFNFSPDLFTFRDAISLGFLEHTSLIQKLSEDAKEEMAIEYSLSEIKERQANIIDGSGENNNYDQGNLWESQLARLESDNAVLSFIRTSEFCSPFQDTLDQLERQVADSISSLKKCNIVGQEQPLNKTA